MPKSVVALFMKSKQWSQPEGQSTDKHKEKCGLYTTEL